MAHVESADQALSRLRYSAERHGRTIAKADGDQARVRRAGFHHLRTVQNTRRQVRYNGAIPSLERGVLGTSGSPETLKRFRELAKEIGAKAGQPLVVVEAVEQGNNEVQQALVGEISGALQVRDSFSSGRGFFRSVVKRPQQTASLVVQTEPLIRFSRDESDWRIRAVDPADEDASYVRVADIVLDETAIPSDDPEQDFTVHDYAEESAVLLGEEAISSSQLFEPDLKTIMMLSGRPL